jgi:hypothetical protein
MCWACRRPSQPPEIQRKEDRYVFERDALLAHQAGVVTVDKIDFYKHECFILEAKQGSIEGSHKVGAAKRDTMLSTRNCVTPARSRRPRRSLSPATSGCRFDLYAAFNGSTDYCPFPNALRNRLFLSGLDRGAPTHAPLDLPRAPRPRPHQATPPRSLITREVASQLAELAKSLDAAGHRRR